MSRNRTRDGSVTATISVYKYFLHQEEIEKERKKERKKEGKNKFMKQKKKKTEKEKMEQNKTPRGPKAKGAEERATFVTRLSLHSINFILQLPYLSSSFVLLPLVFCFFFFCFLFFFVTFGSRALLPVV